MSNTITLSGKMKTISLKPKRAKSMRMIMLHGRDTLAEDMPDWGYDGPVLRGITAMHCTYGNFVVHFKDEASATEARRVTGWKTFSGRDDKSDHTAEFALVEGLMPIVNPEGKPEYYGDWELQTQTGSGKAVS